MKFQEELLQIIPQLSLEQQEKLLAYARELKANATVSETMPSELGRILEEDAELLQWLAQ